MEIELKELVELLARYLANHPEQICVEEIRGSRTSVLLLKASREDISGIIGKDGRNAEAMRTILTATASRLRKKALLEILD